MKQKAYEEDLQKYGYVKQSTINRFASYQESTIPIKKSNIGLSLLKKMQEDIAECWYISNDTVNAITWYIPPRPKKKTKKKTKKKKRVAKVKVKQEKKRTIKDSHIYHRIFTRHYWDIKRCMRCGSTDTVQIHHKDKNHKNNDISNLIKLCYKCHCLAHKWDRVYNLMISRDAKAYTNLSKD